MADISAIFFILLIIGVAFPAMLAAWWLLFPSLITRAQTRVDKTPWKTFWMGLAVVIALAIPIVILLALPFGPAKFIGWMLLAAALAVSAIGSAGIATHLSERMKKSGSTLHPSRRIYPRLQLCWNSPPFSLSSAGSLSCLSCWSSAFGATGFALLNWKPREKLNPAHRKLNTPNRT